MSQREPIVDRSPLAAVNSTNNTNSNAVREQELAQVREALAGLNYGEVSIVVQDGVVVQIVRTEKRRIRKANS